MNTRIIIDRRYTDGESKKYRSTQEQIEQNRRENEAQRLRDESARAEALRNQESSANRNANRVTERA